MYHKYLKKSNEKKVPTVFLFFYLFFLFFFINRYFKNIRQPIISKAINLTIIDQLEVINITDRSAVVFWRTKKKLPSSLIFGTESKKVETELNDIRSINNLPYISYNHFVYLKDLMPGRKYYFKIKVFDQIFQDGNQPLAFKTKNNFIAFNNIPPFFGKVKKDREKIDDGVIILTIDGAELLGDYLKENGEWVIPLHYLIKKNTDEQFYPKENTKVSIKIFNNNHSMEIKTFFSNLHNLPKEIIFGQSYDFYSFDKEKNVLSEKINKNFNRNFDIIFPKEGAVIPGRKPLIKGISNPNSKIKVIFDNPRQIYEIFSDKDGIWLLSPFYDLNFGKRIIIVSGEFDGKSVKLERSFVIPKSGELVLGEATLSAQTKPKEEITPILTSTPTPFETLTPTISTTTDLTYERQNINPTQPMPVSGFEVSYFKVLGIFFVIIGAVFYFFL